MLALVRNGSVPKEDAWVSEVLDFLVVHGFFTVAKANKKSKCAAVHTVPSPAISETTAAICRSRFFSSIVELSVQSTLVKGEWQQSMSPADDIDGDETRKLPGCDSKGDLWLTRCLKTVADLEADKKHASPVLEADEEIAAARADARKTIEALSKVSHSAVCQKLTSRFPLMSLVASRSSSHSCSCRPTTRMTALWTCSRYVWPAQVWQSLTLNRKFSLALPIFSL